MSAVLLSCGAAAHAAETVKSGTRAADSTQSKTDSTQASRQSKKRKPVGINSATAAQLKTVAGIGDAEAQWIIKHRPYMARSHLISKDAPSREAYLVLKDRIIVIPPELP